MTAAFFVTPDEAMVIAARAMNALPSYDEASSADARAIYLGAAQIAAVADRVPIPAWLYNSFADDILSRAEA